MSCCLASYALELTSSLEGPQIRFFERVKLERQIKQAQKGITEAPPTEHVAMGRQLAKLRDDLQVGGPILGRHPPPACTATGLPDCTNWKCKKRQHVSPDKLAQCLGIPVHQVAAATPGTSVRSRHLCK